VATLRAGDYVGETALLENSRRTATVTSKNETTMLRISQDKFKELKLHRKLKFAKRKAVGGGQDEAIVTKPPSVKTPSERELMGKALRSNANMEGVITWTDDLVSGVIDIAWKEDVEKGTEIIKHGDSQAHHFYIINRGSFEFLIPTAVKDGEDPETSAQKGLVPVGSVQAGGSFGELALMYNHPRAATVKALENSVVWVMDRTSFKNMLVKGSDETQAYVKCLNKIAIFDSLLQVEKESVANAMTPVAVKKGDVLMKQGEPGDRLYILSEGSVDITKDGNVVANLVAGQTMEESHIIGEQALLSNEPRGATATVASADATLLVLERRDFEQLLGSVQDIMSESAEQRAKNVTDAGKRATASGSSRKNDSIAYDSLVSKGLLGCGAFGIVDLVKCSETPDTFFALKGLNKGWIVKSGMQKRTQSERDILMMLDSQFIVKLHACYNESQTLYFLLELAQGGELFEVYEKLSLAGSPPHAKYYSASVALAFHHLHTRKIIYRDLKPENLLLDKDGHLKVTDMGLAKFTFGKTYSTCGTPEYFSPEVVQSVGHTVAADWWALGILIYEMLDGSSPFQADTTAQIYKKIVKGITHLKWRGVWKEKKSSMVKELIIQLLQEDPKKRLPMLMDGIGRFKKDSWYTDTKFDWAALEAGTLMAPYKPPNVGKGKVTNFAASDADKPPQMEYEDDGTGWDRDFAT
jgi:CRP-like cAMP-binding protein